MKAGLAELLEQILQPEHNNRKQYSCCMRKTMRATLINWIRPRVITIILFCLMTAYSLLLVSTGHSHGGVARRIESTYLMGFGPCVQVKTVYVDDKKVEQSIEIYWLRVFINVAAFYVLALLITRLVGKHTRLLTSVIILTLLLAFLGAITASKMYWGYFLRRPGLDRRIRNWDRVISITPVSTERQADGTGIFVVDGSYSISNRIKYGRSDSYYCLDARILIALEDKGKLPDSPNRMEAELLSSLYGRLDSSGILVEGDPGYDEAKLLHGVVVEAVGKDNQRYVFVGVKGLEVSNDHRPYYEFLFKTGKQTSELKLLSCNQFFYDVAGIEGLEWPIMFLYLSGFGLLVTAPITLVVIMFIRLIRGAKVSSPRKLPVLRRFRWGIIFASVYFIVALSCYVIYSSDRHEYSIPMFIFYYSSFPVYVAFAEVLKAFRLLSGFIYFNELILVIMVLFFTTVLYFWIGQGLACVLSIFRKKKSG